MRRRALDPDTARHRARASTYPDVLAGTDGRSAMARRFRDIVRGLVADLGPAPTAGELLQIRTAASLQLHAEAIAAALVNGEPTDPEEASRAGNAAIRAVAGLRRRGRRGREGSSAPGLTEYLASRPKS